ncbi:efflux RND transporter periplasmic adaptor subunit [Kaistia dalseonensis]|uniref:Multidrug efflux system membrane fusion protein n=1 Tax=Kaistia dalseonensis TaxID=410840 RepID=A0ABU0H9K3_9HYPH|nr:efflux RND transporter periplasmic adaptor subunit [Kaistia dalseonensis]MCX5496378.1 efflux RND transporter periplasmic adaptor subunit [Kaistia dalseonensis]MDQ0438999.1 multidrug efflux system membrane fusion protein [Kaistia dalseonensis]
MATAVLAAAAFAIVRMLNVPPPPAAPPAPVPVQVATAATADVPVYLTGLGTVQAYNTVTVKTRIDGELQQVLFREGQDVKKGDLLAIIDPRSYQAALQQAQAKLDQDKADLANAQLILARYADLQKGGFSTVQDYDTQKSVVQQLQAQIVQDQSAIAVANTALSYTQITAPLDGRTGLRLIDQGNIVYSTDTTGLVVVTQLQPISVIATVPEQAQPAVAAALASGTVVAEALPRGGDTALDVGSLTLMDNQIDPASGTLKLKATFPNSQNRLWPGQFVNLRLTLRVEKNVTTVPSAALQRGPDGYLVYAIQPDGTVQPRAVQPGQIAEGTAIVKSGLARGDRVVTAGQYGLRPGVRVKIQSAPAAPASLAAPEAAS